MTMLLHDGTNHDGLFDLLGLCFFALDTLNTDRSTGVSMEFGEFVAGAELLSGATGTPTATAAIDAISALPDAVTSWQTDTTLSAALQTAAENLVVAFCQADDSGLSSALADNLTYLVAQMTGGTVTGGDHVTAPTASLTATTGGSSTGNDALKTTTYGANSGDVAVCATLLRGDGLANQNAFPETIALAAAATATAPTVNLASPVAIADSLSYLWPGGSGLGGSFLATDAAASLLANGNFESDAVTNQPDDWIIAVGTPTTTLFVTAQCVQTVAIGGGPTGGTYNLYWTDPYGNNRATAPLAYNAQQGDVQTALQAIGFLGAIQVATTGTTPNYTHTITFYGVGGAVPALTYTSQLTGGSPTVAINTTTAADANTYNGQALKIVGNGSELTTLYQPLPALLPNTTYFLGFRACAKNGDTIAAGALAVEVVNGIGGSFTALTDTAGNSNSLSVNLTTLAHSSAGSAGSNGWTFFAMRVSVPATIIQPVYLRLRLSTAITTGKAIYLDEIALTQGTELYAGGPNVAAFSGRLPAQPGDAWAITVSNDLAGEFQKDFERFFDMNDLGLLLPTSSAVSGALISDSLIA